MGSERRLVIYGRYCHGREAAIGNFNESEVPDDTSIEHIRTETTGYSIQSHRVGNLINKSNSQQENPFDFGSEQPIHRAVGVRNYNQYCIPEPASASNRQNHYRYGGLIGNQQPGDPFELRPLQTFRSQQRVNNTNYYNEDCMPGSAFASNRQSHSGYGTLIDNQQPADPSQLPPQHAFNRQAALGAVRVNNTNHYNEDCMPGSAFASNRQSHSGYGTLIDNQQPADPSQLPPQHAFNRQAALGAVRVNNTNHYNEDCMPGSAFASYRQSHSGYGSLIGNQQPADPSQLPIQEAFSRHGVHPGVGLSNINHCNRDYVSGSASEYNRQNYNGYGRLFDNHQQPEDPLLLRPQQVFSRQALNGRDNNIHINDKLDRYSRDETFESEKHPSASRTVRLATSSYHPIDCSKPPSGPENEGIREACVEVGEFDYITLERSKLVRRVKKLYDGLAPLLFSKNSEKFDKDDWMKVFHVSCDGMKIYQAEMFCPICFGKVTPQNRVKEAGMLPKWELTTVKRHVITLHPEKRKEICVDEKQNQQLEQYIEKVKHLNEKDKESNKATESHVKKINHLAEKVDQPKEKTDQSEEMVDKMKLVEGGQPLVDENKQLDDKDKSSKEEKKGTTKRSADESSYESSESSSLFGSDSSSDSSSDSIGQPDIEKRKITRKTKTKGERVTECKNRKKEAKSVSSKKRCRKMAKDSSSSASQSEVEDNNLVPDWKKSGVHFGWVKLTKKSRFQPAFIFPQEKKTGVRTAKYIKTKGSLSDEKHPLEAIATPTEVERAKKSKKSNNYLKAIQLFNSMNNTEF